MSPFSQRRSGAESPWANVFAFITFALAWLSPFALAFAYFFFQLSCEERCPTRSWQTHAQLIVAAINLGLGGIAVVAMAREKETFIKYFSSLLIAAWVIWIALVLSVPL